MNRAIGGAVLLVLTCGGVVVAADLMSNESKDAAPPASARNSLADEQLRISTPDGGRTLGPESFCAAPNGEAVSLACGSAVRAPRGRALSVRAGTPLSLRFGSAAERVSFHLGRVLHDGQTVAMTYDLPLRSSGNAHVWQMVVPRDVPLRVPRTVLTIGVVYRDGVRLGLRDRLSKPFTDASAEFAVPLQELR
jgi:hypothetical protein